jgi:hypothetical protein
MKRRRFVGDLIAARLEVARFQGMGLACALRGTGRALNMRKRRQPLPAKGTTGYW